MLQVATKQPSKLRVVIPLLLVIVLAGGLYVGYIRFSPQLDLLTVNPSDNATTRELTQNPPKTSQLYIPRIDLSIGYYDSEASLDTGAWWRQPLNGNPKDGGNFVLTAYQFRLGFLPGETQRYSPFYHLTQLEIGDDIIVDYQNVRYTYRVSQTYRIQPGKRDIEARTAQPQLTLYTMGVGNETQQRQVVIATPAS